jgi:hypothetical protein
MSNSYFSKFPKIRYFGVVATNATLRAAFTQRLKQLKSVYYPYVIDNGETADSIAAKYYGDPALDWLVYMTNDIVDPYTQWPKNQVQFESYIIKKYGSLQAAQSTIAYYKKYPEVTYISTDGKTYSTVPPAQSGLYTRVETYTDIRITPDTYAQLIGGDVSLFFPVYVYDDEVQQNEQKRFITLIDDSFADQINSELRDVLNG